MTTKTLDKKKKDIINPHLSPELKKVIYSATKSEREYNFFADAFKKMQQSEIQKVLNAWFNVGKISISKRDVLKAV